MTSQQRIQPVVLLTDKERMSKSQETFRVFEAWLDSESVRCAANIQQIEYENQNWINFNEMIVNLTTAKSLMQNSKIHLCNNYYYKKTHFVDSLCVVLHYKNFIIWLKANCLSAIPYSSDTSTKHTINL